MNKYRNAFTEVYTILETLEYDEYEKIPQEVIGVIINNRNTEYEYELDEEKELREQSMLPETKAILFNLFRDYLSEPEQQEKIIRMQKEERQRNERKKQQTYNTDVFADRQKEKVSNENVQLVEYIESFFMKILKFIKKIFKHK